jgi:hypothetical protein
MDIITTLAPKQRSAVSTQIFHVYRHVDIEKLQSKALITNKTLTSSDNGARGSVANLGAAHEKALVFANRSLLGGVLWIA